MNDGRDDVTQLREVRAAFDDPARMQSAVDKLSLSGFDRADLTLPTQGHSLDESNPETTSKAVSTDADARQARTLGSSTAAAAAALAAVGLTVATGGAAAPAVAAAMVAGGVAGGATFAATGAATGAEQQERQAQASDGGLMLSVRALSAAKQAQAVEILRAEGATNIETFG